METRNVFPNSANNSKTSHSAGTKLTQPAPRDIHEMPEHYTGFVLYWNDSKLEIWDVQAGHHDKTIDVQSCQLKNWTHPKHCWDTPDTGQWIPLNEMEQFFTEPERSAAEKMATTATTGYASVDVHSRNESIPLGPKSAGALHYRMALFAARMIAKGSPEVLQIAEGFGLAICQNLTAPCCDTCQCVDEGKTDDSPCVTLIKPLQGLL